MPVADDVVRRAKTGEPRAMEELLADAYPSVYRMAHALTGRTGAARQVMHGVLRRGLRVMQGWRVGTVPENWFYHHTLLSARDFGRRPPDPREDLLVAAAGEAAHDPFYVAFVKTLRNLPPQQSEAFILHHGEKLNDRLLGVAMDCSTNAAHTHLAAATQALASASGPGMGVLTSTLGKAYHALTPPQTAIAPIARRYVRHNLRPRLLRRLVRLFILAALLAAAYFAWRERRRWLPLVNDLKQRWLPSTPATAPAPSAILPPRWTGFTTSC